MAEQLTLQQIVRYRSAVDCHHFLVCPGTQLVQCPGNDLFASATGTQQQGRDIGGRHFLNRATDFQHFRAGSNNPSQRGLQTLFLESTVLGFQLINTVSTVNNQCEDIRINRLLIKIVGAKTNGLDRIGSIIVTRYHDHFCLR